MAHTPLIQLSEPVLQPPQPQPQPQPKQASIKINIMQVYKLEKRSVALKLDPHTQMFKGQITFELNLIEDLAQRYLEYYKEQQAHKLNFEAAFSCKQIHLVSVSLLGETASEAKLAREKTLQLKDSSKGSLAKPED